MRGPRPSRPILPAAILALLLVVGRARAAPIPGRIAFIGVDQQVYVVDPNGGAPRALTHGDTGRFARGQGVRAIADEEPAPPLGDQRFSWPTWSPDGKALLVQGVRAAPQGIVRQSGVYRIAAGASGAPRPLYEDEKRPPIYTFWSPSGGDAALLVGDTGGLTLGLLDGLRGDFRPIALGFPFYFAWRGDGKALALHRGGAADEGHPAEVDLVDAAGVRAGKAPSWQTLSEKPAAFHAPAWSPDGSLLAYAAEPDAEGPVELVLRATASGRERRLAPVSSPVAFSWCPDGRWLAVAEAAAPDTPFFSGINVVALSDGRREPIYAGPVGAFFWSPDGSALAVASPDAVTGQWRWEIVERRNHRVREVARFRPSPEFQMTVQHFDQFALSHRLWAPDSRHLVFAAYPASRGEGEVVPPGVWLVDTRAGTSRKLADGRAAFWSPR